jgi:microcin-processing metallopeptidase PmbA/TldD-like protein
MKILAITLFSSVSAFAADDVVMRAMRDELERSMRKLQLENLQKPYFISYRSVETQGCSMGASFGALTNSYCEPASSSHARSRNLSVEVRVGDYTRDNTNFFAPMSNAGVARPLGTGGASVPIDDNYDELRRQLWLSTDSAYKNALDTYAKKKAALENRTRTEDAPDFSKEEVVKFEQARPPIMWNRPELEKTVKALSALFRETPGIDGSSVALTSNVWLTRYVNSEGTSYVRGASGATLTINADAQAADGMPITDFEVIHANSLDQLPPRDEIVRRIRALQSRLEGLRKATDLDRYTGPVLFESDAVAELFLQALGSALAGVPRVVVDDLRFERVYSSNGGFAERIGTRVLPEFLTVTDDPSAREFRKQPLFGGYDVDDDGVTPHPTVLVDKGILKTLVHTRALIPGTTRSTANRRGNGPMPSNLLITSDKSRTPEELRAELLRMTKQRGNEFGIVVKRMANPMTQSPLNRSRIIIRTSGNGPGNISVEPLIEAYKVFPDGHEELVRNLNLNSLTLASFKDIVAVSDVASVYTAPMRMTIRSPAMMMSFLPPGGPSFVSVGTPAMLFDDMTLQRPTGDVPNLPFTKHPFFDK